MGETLSGERRGADLLLAHCTALSATRSRASARHRLERQLGSRLAALLLRALSGDHGTRGRLLEP